MPLLDAYMYYTAYRFQLSAQMSAILAPVTVLKKNDKSFIVTIVVDAIAILQPKVTKCDKKVGLNMLINISYGFFS